MNCKGCNLPRYIVNKHFGLCYGCNNIRLHGSKYGKPIKHTSHKEKVKQESPLWALKAQDKPNRIVHLVQGGRNMGKSLAIYILDEQFYEEVFNQSNHICEECGEQLPIEFRDSEGKIIARFRYSHIIAKSIAPELRHDLRNMNDLCFLCHQKWDFGEKTKMKIYKKNQKIFPQYLNK